MRFVVHSPVPVAARLSRPRGGGLLQPAGRVQHAPLTASAVLSLLLGCGTPVTPGTTEPVSAGESPSSLAPALPPAGGIVELARVTLAGGELSTGLLGASPASDAAGQVLVVGGAALAYPPTTSPHEVALALPLGPDLRAGETVRCDLQVGSPRSLTGLPGVPVEVGAYLQLENSSGTPLFRLDALFAAESGDSSAPPAYQRLEVARSTSDPWSDVNWAAGGKVGISFPGGAPGPEQARGAVPFAAMLEARPLLPLRLEALSIGGVAVRLPARDGLTGQLLETPQRFVLPDYDGSLALSWKRGITPQRMTASLELYGVGEGRCPRACGTGASCCLSDSDCSSLERCEGLRPDGSSACFPLEGDASDRLAALVCTLHDGGEADPVVAEIPGAEVQRLLQVVSADAARGVILRVGRSTQTSVVWPDARTPDETRAALSPVLVRAADVVFVRFEPPAGE